MRGLHVELDRVSPSRRPAEKPTGTQRWRHLLFVHWAVPPAAVRPLVPAGLELDLWDGQALMGLVPFEMHAVRSAWMPAGAGLTFLETNVRTYVHVNGEPGVFFFSLEASSWLAVRVARLVWSLPYFHAKMTHEVAGRRHVVRSTRARSKVAVDLAFTRGALLGPSPPGTYEHFVLERYILYAQHAGRLRRGQVHHAPYPAESATLESLDETLLAAAGVPCSREPLSVHYAEGVDVEVFGPCYLA